MLKLERRYENGRLSEKDLNLWLSGKEPLEVHKMMTDFWKVYIEPPKITIGWSTAFSPRLSNRITVGIKGTLEHGRILKQTGIKLPLKSILKVNVGEEFTHRMSYYVAPQNFEREQKLRDSSIKNENYEDFLKAAAIGSQSEAIGCIGRGHVAKKIGIENYEEIEKRLLDIYYKERNKYFAKITSTENNKGLSKLKKTNTKEYKEASDEFRELILEFIKNTTSGAGQYLVFNEFEKEHSDRFPQLIRDTLEPEDKYRKQYLEFIGIYFPNFKEFLESALL